MTLILRSDVSRALTNSEVDDNWKHLRDLAAGQATDISTIQSQISGLTAGVNTVNGEGGPDVTLTVADIPGAVSSVNTLTGSVISLTVANIPGAAPLASPAFTGSPTIATNPLITSDDLSVATTHFTKLVAAAAAHTNQEITYLGNSTTDSIMMVSGGRLYIAHTNEGVNGTSLNGLGDIPPGPLGAGVLHNWNQVILDDMTSPIKQVGVIGKTAFVLLDNGKLYMWGNNINGQCGSPAPAYIPLPTRVLNDVTTVYTHPSTAAYSANASTTFVKRADNFIYVCGNNHFGQAGLGSLMTGGVVDAPNQSITAFTQVTSLGTNVINLFNLGSTLGAKFAIKPATSGPGISIWACGWNGEGAVSGDSTYYGAGGQLGTGDVLNKTAFTKVTDNTISQWGGSTAGDVISMHAPGAARGYRIAYEMATTPGSRFEPFVGMLRRTSGGVTSFRLSGANNVGQLGNGTTTPTSNPVTVPLSTDVKQVAIQGGYKSSVFMLNNNGQLYAWGDNYRGNLGTHDAVDHHTVPTQVTKLVGGPLLVDSILSDGMTSSNGGWETQTIVKGVDNLLYVAGYSSDYGESGIGTVTSSREYVFSFKPVALPPTAIPKYVGWFVGSDPTHFEEFTYTGIDPETGMMSTAVSYSPTEERARTFVVVTTNNKMYCWGANTNGQIDGGTGTSTLRHPSTPMLIQTIPNGE